MDEETDGWIDEWVSGWMDALKDGQVKTQRKAITARRQRPISCDSKRTMSQPVPFPSRRPSGGRARSSAPASHPLGRGQPRCAHPRPRRRPQRCSGATGKRLDRLCASRSRDSQSAVPSTREPGAGSHQPLAGGWLPGHGLPQAAVCLVTFNRGVPGSARNMVLNVP